MLAEIIDAVQGTIAGDPPPLSISSVSTDSRSIAPDGIFFALAGERFDGHDFIGGAFEKGARAAVVSASRATEIGSALARTGKPSGLLIAVDDVLVALGRLAAFHRRQLACDVIAVVGSNGKTTTKAMIDHILAGRLKGRASPKSFNNAIGVPLTLLSAERADDYLVVEIGTNALGEIAQLAQLAAPNMAILTSIGEEHLEGLGDLRGVAAEECAVLQHLRPGGFAAMSLDSPAILPHLSQPGLNVTTFGRDDRADVRVTHAAYEYPWLKFSLNGRFPYKLKLPGIHNAANAAGAATIARRFGLDHPEIAARLETFAPPPMRNDVARIGPLTIINDAYNANPASAAAAIELLESMPADGRRVLVFGEMRELGTHSAAMHQQVAARLHSSRLNEVLLVGPVAEAMQPTIRNGGGGPGVKCVADVQEASAQLCSSLAPGDVVLLKASRAVGLERVLEPLRAHFDAGGAPA